MSLPHHIQAGWFIDGSGADVQRNVFLAVKGGIITAIGPAKELPSHEGAAIDDFSHCTILPALVDCSVSLSLSPSVDRKVRLSSDEANLEEKADMQERHIHYCLTHGVLSVVDSDDKTTQVERYLEEVGKKNILNIRTSGRDFLRINYSADIENENAKYPLLNYEELCCKLKDRGGKKAVVVANGPQQIEAALDAGCDAIEQGYGMSEDNLRKMAKKGVLWIPSILRAKNSLDSSVTEDGVGCRFSTRYVAEGKADAGAEAYWKKMLAEQTAQLRLARDLSVKTAVGTGAGSVGILHGESMVEEMKLFIKAGYSLVETIQCASENGAGFFDLEKLGALTPGRKATFLITRGTPAQLPRKLSYLEAIYLNGRPCSKEFFRKV